jgi:hypothetical protein
MNSSIKYEFPTKHYFPTKYEFPTMPGILVHL